MLRTWVAEVLSNRRRRRRFPSAVFHPGSVLSDDSTVGRYTVLFPGATLLSSSVGSYTYVQADTAIYNGEVGPFCSIAPRVTIGLASHPTHMVSSNPVFYDHLQPLPRFFTRKRPYPENLPRTIISADVWIGQNAMIKAGVRVGTGAVIAAGAIVTKDVNAYDIVGGTPAKLIRPRFDSSLAARLLASRWWELDDARLIELADLFPNPHAMLTALEASSS